MTLDEARRELGVAAADDDETVRRAYLRLLKTRKPDADPIGFQRLREAYEVARARGGALVEPETPRQDAREKALVDLDVSLATPIRDEKRWWELVMDFRAAVSASAPAPPPHAAIDEILRLLERYEVESALHLSHALGEWVEAMGEIHALPGNLRIPWRVARGLAELGRYAPPRLVGAFAEAERTGRMKNAIAAANAIRRGNPVLADQVEAFMRRSLFGVEYLTELLRNPAADLAPVVRPPAIAFLGAVVPLLFIVVRAVLGDPLASREIAATSEVGKPAPTATWPEAKRTRGAAAAVRLTALRRSLGERQGVDQALRGFTPGGCADAAREAQALRALREQVRGDGAALQLVDDLIADWAELCTETPGAK